MPKAIINKHSFFNWRFVGCSGDWESFEEAYGYSPQFLIEPETHIQTVSWDEIFYDSGMVSTSFIENWEDFDTPKNRKEYGDDLGDYDCVEIEASQLGQIIGDIEWSDKDPYATEEEIK